MKKVKKHGIGIRLCAESRFLLNRAARLYETVYRMIRRLRFLEFDETGN